MNKRKQAVNDIARQITEDKDIEIGSLKEDRYVPINLTVAEKIVEESNSECMCNHTVSASELGEIEKSHNQFISEYSHDNCEYDVGGVNLTVSLPTDLVVVMSEEESPYLASRGPCTYHLSEIDAVDEDNGYIRVGFDDVFVSRIRQL